jgi:hypothetical protein
LHAFPQQIAPPAQSALVLHATQEPVALHTWLPPLLHAVPTTADAHVPLAPPVSAAEQAWQVPVHAPLQHTPSTQKPLAHWSVALHVAPFVCLGTQAIPAQ